MDGPYPYSLDDVLRLYVCRRYVAPPVTRGAGARLESERIRNIRRQ